MIFFSRLLVFLELALTKSFMNLKSEAKRNKLSYLWWVVEPLLYMGIFYFVFGVLLFQHSTGATGSEFVVYLITGLVPFQWFAKGILMSAPSILDERFLMQQVRINPVFFPFVSVLQSSIKQVPVFLMLVAFLLLMGYAPNLTWLGLLPVFLLQFLLMTVLGLLVAMMVVVVKDLLQIIPTGVQFLMFFSGVFFTAERVPVEFRDLFFMNPIASLLEVYRTILMAGEWPSWDVFLQLVLVVGAIAMAVLVVYGLVHRNLVKVAMR